MYLCDKENNFRYNCSNYEIYKRGVLQMSNGNVENLREDLDALNLEKLDIINKRAGIVQEIGEIKSKQSTQAFDTVRERDMLNHIIDHNNGQFKNATVEHIFKEIFKAGLEIQVDDQLKDILVSRNRNTEDTVIKLYIVLY